MSQTRPTAEPVNTPTSWLSIEGRTRIRGIIEERIPQWRNGPHSWQVEAWAHTLQNIPLVLIASTGAGKTASFYGPILVMLHILKNPVSGLCPPPESPVALVVTPLIELGNNHVREMDELSLKALAVNAESLTAAAKEGRNLLHEVRDCEWNVVLISPERLGSREFDGVVRNEKFRKNLVVYGIDEGHVLVPWGLSFRAAYHQVSLLRKRLPDHVALVVVTATLAPGHDYSMLVASLGLKEGTFRCLRLSSERPNVRTVITELQHSLNGYKFPDVEWVFKPGIKAVVYCRTIELGFRVGVYGWSLFPPGANRLQCVRLWNSLTSASYNAKTLELFNEEPGACAIIASVAFGMGMNIKNIIFSINLGVPDTCDALVQQNGRAGRDLQSTACGWTYLESSTVATVSDRKDGGEGDLGVCSDSELDLAKKKKKKKGKRGRPNKSISASTSNKGLGGVKGRVIDENLGRIIYAHLQGNCLEVEKNSIYGNPGESAQKRCEEAQRRLPCSSCQPFWNALILPSPTMPADFVPPSPPANELSSSVRPKRTLGASLPSPLTRVHREYAIRKLWDFAAERWALKDGARYRLAPHIAFWPLQILDLLIDRFHLIRSYVSLSTLLCDWEFIEGDGQALFMFIESLNRRFDSRVQRGKELKVQKAAATRAKNQAKKRQRASTPLHTTILAHPKTGKTSTSHPRMASMKENAPPVVAASSSQMVPTTHSLVDTSQAYQLQHPSFYYIPAFAPSPFPYSSPHWVPPPPLFAPPLTPFLPPASVPLQNLQMLGALNAQYVGHSNAGPLKHYDQDPGDGTQAKRQRRH